MYKENRICKGKVNNKTYKSHYYTGLLSINYNNYINDLKKAGMYEFEE